MEFNLFKNISKESIISAFVKASKETSTEKFTEISLEDLKQKYPGQGITVDLFPGSRLRKKGCLQRGQVKLSSRARGFDRQPLYLVLSCARKWAKQEEINMQRYALVVSINHSNPEVNLYSQLKLRTEIAQRIRIR